jgi:hypothetical protein
MEQVMMKKNQLLVTIGGGAFVLAAGLLIPSLVASGSNGIQSDYPVGSSYAPLPASMTTGFGVTLDQLSSVELSAVSITTAQAISVAQAHEFATVSSTGSPSVVLGDFTDSEYGTPGTNGPSDLVAANIPSYVVTFSNVALQSYGPEGGSIRGQYSVVVNADTGAYVMAYAAP